jgi:hypothetical protein
MDEAIAILKRDYVMLFKRLIRVALADLGETERAGSRCLDGSE